jgi:hypothetical protein
MQDINMLRLEHKILYLIKSWAVSGAVVKLGMWLEGAMCLLVGDMRGGGLVGLLMEDTGEG